MGWDWELHIGWAATTRYQLILVFLTKSVFFLTLRFLSHGIGGPEDQVLGNVIKPSKNNIVVDLNSQLCVVMSINNYL